PPGCYAGFRNFGPTERAEYARRQLVKTFLGIAAAVILVVLMTFANTISRIVSTVDTDATINENKLGFQTTSPTPFRSPMSASPAPPPAAHTGTVKPLKASVFSPGGAPDNPNSARLAIDGDPATAWSTDTYFDAEPFPKFKDGVGLLLQLPEPTALS